MMEMADNPKLDLAATEENLGTQKISVLDHINGIQYTAEKSDNFVIDMESISHGGNDKEINPNLRITLQRSLSRKGIQRGGGGEKKSNTYSNDRDAIAQSSSPREQSMPEKATVVADSINPQTHHQITITTTASNMNAATESRFATKRNSFKRPSVSWTIDPKRVLFFFATLSSMGTMLLIYFTLSMGKLSAEDRALD